MDYTRIQRVDWGTALVDRELRFIQADEALAKFHGRRPEDYPGQEVAAVLPEHISKVVLPLYRHVIATGLPVRSFEFETRSIDNLRTMLCRAHYVPTGSGCVLATVSYAEDVQLAGLMNHDEWNRTECPVEALSKAERCILSLLALGRCTKEIATTLHISPLTVATHRKHICRKTGARSTAELISIAGEQPVR